MHFFGDYFLTFVSNILQSFIFLTGIFYLFLSLKGFSRRAPRLYPRPEGEPASGGGPLKRFAVIVPAYNEEGVIGFTLGSLQKMDYPRRLFDVFVVADHCTDSTAEIAGDCQAEVYRHDDPLPAGKGYALQWATEKVLSSGTDYDAVCYFDADSLAHPQFLKTMSLRLNAGEKVIQGRQLSKNPGEGWIPRMLCTGHIISNRFYQEPKSRFGMSATFHGKGICMSSDVARAYPWDGTCLTEDLEMQMRLVRNNVRISWALDAVVYEEEPVTVLQYVKRTVRWTAGALDVARRHMAALFVKGFKDRDLSAFESGLWCSHVYRLGIAASAGLLIYYSRNSFNLLVWIFLNLPGTATFVKLLSLIPLIIYPAVALGLERAGPKLFAAYFLQPVLGLLRVPIYVAGIFRNRSQWGRIDHSSRVAISDLVKSEHTLISKSEN